MELEGTLHTLARIGRLLDSFAGRDKVIRSLYFTLVLMANRMRDLRRAEWLMALARQLSRTRLICRMFSQPSLLHSALCIPQDWRHSGDRWDSAMGSTVQLLYLLCGWHELAAWLVEANSAKQSLRWFRRALRLWVLALLISIVRCLQQIVTRLLTDLLSWRKSDRNWLRAQCVSLAGFAADFVAAVSSLPRGILWAGKLSGAQCAAFHLLASVVGVYKQW